MRNYVAAGAALAASISGVNADLCSIGSALIGGNWYCQAVTGITYQNFAMSGTYPRVVSMDSSSGSCSSVPQAFSGSLAPLNDEVSMHFRGPVSLKQFAFYSPTGAAKAKRDLHDSHHAHAHFHEHHNEVREAQEKAEAKKQEAEKRQMVTAVINGATVSWDWSAPAATGGSGWITAVIDGKTVSWANPAAATGAPAAAAAAAAAPAVAAAAGAAKAAAPAKAYSPPAPATAGAWVRSAYYDAASQTAKGVTFLNNMGGQGSGVFDYSFGNSLSYASSDAASGAASPEVLADMTIPSNKEVIIMSDKACAGSDCGFYRPGTVAYHGFGGAEKLFVMEFSMPDDGTSGWNMNMPAIWMLNALIPRTLQYGNAACTCWPNCGEFDLFEVLDSGNTKAKSTVHAIQSGGDSDYFVRPTGSTIKAAVLMSASQAHIKILPNSFSFDQSLAPSFINGIASSTQSQSNGVSLFSLP